MWAVKHFRHYLYGHRCTVYTDHEALKSLLNTPHPSGNLARWGMAIQELDLKIEYQPGKANGRADALSRYPVSLLGDDCAGTRSHPLIAAIEPPLSPAESGEECTGDSLGERQRQDPQLMDIIAYLETGELPQDDRRARELILSRSQFELLEGSLYRINPDKTLRVITPTTDQQKLFLEAHQGVCSGHLREAKIHSQLSQQYWWPGMRKDIASWCRACLTCASRNVGTRGAV